MENTWYRVSANGAKGFLYTQGDSLLFEVTAEGEEPFKEPRFLKLLYSVRHPDMYVSIASDQVPGIAAGKKVLLLPHLVGGGATLRVGPPRGFQDIDLPKTGISITIEDDAYFWPKGKRGVSTPLLDF